MPSHNAEKPWDTDDIDKWKVDTFKPEDNVAGNFAETSEFQVLFPKYREVYLKEAWPLVTKSLEKHGIACTLDLVEGSMAVKTSMLPLLLMRTTYPRSFILTTVQRERHMIPPQFSTPAT
jgi:hypothetical protein